MSPSKRHLGGKWPNETSGLLSVMEGPVNMVYVDNAGHSLKNICLSVCLSVGAWYGYRIHGMQCLSVCLSGGVSQVVCA